MSLGNVQKLQLIQNYAARLVKQAPKRSSASLLLSQLHWLPVKKRIVYKIAVLTYNCLYDNASPVYLKDLISNYVPTRSLRSADKNLLVKPKRKLKTFGDRSFSYAAPDVWNNLPLFVKSSESLCIFKKRLKTHLLNQPFNLNFLCKQFYHVFIHVVLCIKVNNCENVILCLLTKVYML